MSDFNKLYLDLVKCAVGVVRYISKHVKKTAGMEVGAVCGSVWVLLSKPWRPLKFKLILFVFLMSVTNLIVND